MGEQVIDDIERKVLILTHTVENIICGGERPSEVEGLLQTKRQLQILQNLAITERLIAEGLSDCPPRPSDYRSRKMGWEALDRLIQTRIGLSAL